MQKFVKYKVTDTNYWLLNYTLFEYLSDCNKISRAINFDENIDTDNYKMTDSGIFKHLLNLK